MPTAAAVRRMVPRLPGSCTLSSSTQLPVRDPTAVPAAGAAGTATTASTPLGESTGLTWANRRSGSSMRLCALQRASSAAISGWARPLSLATTSRGCQPRSSATPSRWAPSRRVSPQARRSRAEVARAWSCLTVGLSREVMRFMPGLAS